MVTCNETSLAKTTELFLELLRFPSVTPKDAGTLDFLAHKLPHFTPVRIDVAETTNLFLCRRFGEGPHLCFAGHVDVVPSGQGWHTDPFEPVVKEGIVYARGAQDMKSGVCAFVRALQEIEHFEGTLSVMLTSDEEGDATHGTIEILRYLEKVNMLPDMAIVAEPTCEARFGDAIKIGRRGSINGVLEVFGVQGHAAYPEKATNPLHLMASRLEKLAGHCFDQGDAHFAPSLLVLTDLRSGMEVTNVSPGHLKLMFNVRNSTKTSKEAIEAYITSVMEGVKFTLTLSQSAYPFVANAKASIVRALDEAIASVCGVRPKYSTAGGTSDARFLAQFGIETIEFGVVNDTIHAPNECTPLRDVEALKEVFVRVIQTLKETV
ncbi:MAG: succinyl-diaminopimelate desuccinylase [Campylobacterales bacterium]|nr:succinyl-diaminopimelate desuccinylase [Campylobacterales bacterium]